MGGQVCAYPDCTNAVERASNQGAVPKKYCSPSCRVRDYQRRSVETVNDPKAVIRTAAERALRPLTTLQTNDALPFVDEDVRREFKKVREVLQMIERRTTDPPP